MDEIMYEFIQCMHNLLSKQEQLFKTQLKLLSSHTERTSHIIDSIIQIVIKFFCDNSSFKMYDIKIFAEDSFYFKTNRNISVSAMCYNCFLVNTDFSSQYLLRNDIRFGHVVGIMPTLSLYLFIQIMWHLKCEDLLVASLAHLPLDLCTQILGTMIKHINMIKKINELELSRARRLAFLLMYQVYYKCLWLHLGILSEENVTICINQLIRYFDTLLNFLNYEFVTFRALFSFTKKYLQHGILMKNLLRYIKKCMHSKIESYWENCNLAELFTLTYRNFNKHTNYYHMFPANDVKSIIIKLDRKLITLLLYQIRKVESFEYIIWGNVDDDENTIISLQRAIVMECHYLKEFIKQNDFLMTNKQLFLRLKRLIGPRKSEQSILTLEELCHEIANGKLHGMKELIKRYKEWDLSILDFINKRIKSLGIYDAFVILEYLHYKFTYLHTKTEKYRMYVSVLKILIQLTVKDLRSVVQIYVEQHFDDSPLKYLYNERCFIEFVERSPFETNDFSRIKEMRTILIFILLNPKEVLSKFVKYEINTEINIDSFLFRLSFIQSYYTLRIGRYNLLMYILKDILFQQRIALSWRFINFLENALNFQIITADDMINELYITYLAGSYLETTTIDVILEHTYRIVVRKLFTYRTNFVRLIIALLKTSSLLRRCHKIFSKRKVYKKIVRINSIVWYLQSYKILTDEQRDIIYLSGVEPLEMNKLRPVDMLKMIQEYEKRCFVVHQQLRWDPRCPSKLRNYVQSFKLDREVFIRHMILHSCEDEYVAFGLRLTSYFYHFGWANKMIAYKNVMRISAETLQIVLMYITKFSENTFPAILLAMIKFTKTFEMGRYALNQEVCPIIRRILLKTLSSLIYIVNRTPYSFAYRLMLNYVEQEDLSLPANEYFHKINEWINTLNDNEDMIILLVGCTCDKSLYCKYHNSFIENKIAAMYNAYLFTCECIRLPITLPIIGIHRCFERLLRNLCPK